MKSPDGPLDPISPQVPLFLLAKSGRPLVWDHERSKAVIAYSSGPLAVAAARLMRERGTNGIGVLSVSTVERLQDVISQLAHFDVHLMIWDYCGESTRREVIRLDAILR